MADASLAPTKVCTRCKKEKPFIDFPKDRHKKDGLSTICKSCRCEMNGKYKKENKEKVKEKDARWHLRTWEKNYQINGDKLRAKAKLYRDADPKKHRRRLKAWRQANADKVRAYQHARRARELGAVGEYTNRDIEFLLIRQNKKCACCGKSIKSRYHVDHIIPLAKGGINSADNLQLLCPYCNLSKGAKDPIIFMQKNGKLL